MNISQFLETIYLGDRACKSILIDCWNRTVQLQIDCISRVRSETWNYYDAEDIENGWIVFEGVQSCSFDPQGPLPNDLVQRIELEPVEENQSERRFRIKIASVNGTDGHITSCVVTINISASSVHLEDPGKPGIRTVE